MSKNHQNLKNIINSIKDQNYITIEQFKELKYYSIQPGGFSQKNKKSNENQKIIFKALLNMMESQEDFNFIKSIKKHPSKIISKNFKDNLDNDNSSQEIEVVTKDLPSYSICAGNPCVIKKMRFSDDVIKLLEDLKWWDKSVEEIQKIIPIITKANPTKEDLINI